MQSLKVKVKGVVQGVGFRPFVYKLALAFKLRGYVNNDSKGVNILLQGRSQDIQALLDELKQNPPSLAKIDSIETTSIKSEKIYDSFEIIQSDASLDKSTNISPDIAICKECIADIKNPKNHRYMYALTNCTNCGPRYSIIKTVPYDRANTSMAKFKMCETCAKEYSNPLDRRYHAQPICCEKCKPILALYNRDKEFDISQKDIYKKVASLIEDKKILAIKGIGGFHIVCDSTNNEVLEKLRMYKNRPFKPFALMCRDIQQIESFAKIQESERELLESKEAPIVILKKSSNSFDKKIGSLVAPKIDRIGCFLAYTALHHLLFEHLSNPIVATSANLASEPIIINKEQIFKKLPFIDFVLDFDRDIINGVDDSLVQVVDDKIQTLRLARGYAPKVINLPFKVKNNILAVGANAKNSIAFAFEDKMILSAHIGDLDSLEAFEYFERTIETFKRFYDFEPELIIHDKHPSYQTTKWAKLQNKECFELGHHLAHIYACKAEFRLSGDYLGFSFDGTGYGDDKTLWGGEIFIGDERKYSFKPIKLLGAHKAIKEPRRVALSMLFDKFSLEDILELDLPTIKAFSPSEIKILHQSYTKNLNAIESSSVGRLFDAVASLSGVVQKISYEGESGLLCESFYDKGIKSAFAYKIENSVIEIDIIETILRDDLSPSEINSMFINTLVKIIVEISKQEKQPVILSGGVFQNKTLLELVASELKKENIKYYHQQSTPINDGGIALGQLYYAILKTSEVRL